MAEESEDDLLDAAGQAIDSLRARLRLMAFTPVAMGLAVFGATWLTAMFVAENGNTTLVPGVAAVCVGYPAMAVLVVRLGRRRPEGRQVTGQTINTVANVVIAISTVIAVIVAMTK